MREYDDDILRVAERIPTTVPDIIRQQGDLHDVLTADANRVAGVNGLAYFNYLYKIVTETIFEMLAAGRIEHPEFLATLDVELAERYFSAIGAWVRDPKTAPRSWAILFDKAYEPKISALQFAMAGVNAHVNFDLAFSLVATFRRLGLEFDEEYRAECRLINDLFGEKTAQLRDDLQDDWDTVDRLLGDADDWLDDVIVIAKRETAWYAARRIWQDRDDALEISREIRRLDRFASVVGRGLLVRRHSDSSARSMGDRSSITRPGPEK